MAVEIQLTDKYWLTSDTHSWALAERKWRTWKDKKTGEQAEGWVMVGSSWHLTVEDVCQAALERELRSSDARTLQELAESARRAREKLSEAIQRIDQYQTVGQGATTLQRLS